MCAQNLRAHAESRKPRAQPPAPSPRAPSLVLPIQVTVMMVIVVEICIPSPFSRITVLQCFVHKFVIGPQLGLEELVHLRQCVPATDCHPIFYFTNWQDLILSPVGTLTHRHGDAGHNVELPGDE